MAYYKGTSLSSIGLNRRHERIVSARLSHRDAYILEQLSEKCGVSMASIARKLLQAYINENLADGIIEVPTYMG
jgi:hypothetical protein